ncbi:MAG: aminotransferase class V-fold PLP-dependent enzyme [Alphaproteobacteria bacterium]|nr:aminotransferase class V-fold PLP-dependent enzyme [Alphaproteobacteria bacterium]
MYFWRHGRAKVSRFEGIYLDHNATTPAKPGVRDSMLEMLGFPGNVSSIHKAGREARRRIEESRKSIAKLVNAGPRDVIVFTSGATEANNMVLKGAGMERLIVSAIEHPSVLQAAPEAEIIPVLENGVIDLQALDRMLEGNTRQTLLSVMTVNNETGVIQPVEEVVKLARKHSVLVHTDAVQAAGRLALDVQASGVDFMTLSAHKMGGPQGMGCLVIANCAVVQPLLRGGNQEKNLRAGTENLAAIAGFGAAAELADIEDMPRLQALRDRLEAELSAKAPTLKIFGKDALRVANTSMFCLPGATSEMQLIALDLAGICVSNGSACSSGTVKPSHVLKAMGASEDEAASSLRISLGWDTTEEDVEAFIEKWSEMYDRIKNRLSAA